MPNAPDTSPRNLTGGTWLLADMSLNIWALTIVKALGLGYTVTQIVFLRAGVGLVLLAPWAWRSRASFAQINKLPLHALRVVFSALALTTSFFAIARLPFALFTAISFTRPVVMMIMAVVFLKEAVSGRRWIAAAIAFAGVLIAVDPGAVEVTWGLPAMGLAVLFGTSAIVLTRRLSQTPAVVMMVFYTGGLTLLTAPFAIYNWQTILPAHLVPLLAIGVFSQSAQFCFLRAHYNAEAGFLAVLGYFSLILTTSIGYLLFDETPSVQLVIGACLIVGAALWTTATANEQ